MGSVHFFPSLFCVFVCVYLRTKTKPRQRTGHPSISHSFVHSFIHSSPLFVPLLISKSLCQPPFIHPSNLLFAVYYQGLCKQTNNSIIKSTTTKRANVNKYCCTKQRQNETPYLQKYNSQQTADTKDRTQGRRNPPFSFLFPISSNTNITQSDVLLNTCFCNHKSSNRIISLVNTTSSPSFSSFFFSFLLPEHHFH